MLNDQKARPRSGLDQRETPKAPPAFLLKGEGDEDRELTLTVFGNRLKRKRSELVEAYNLGGLPDHAIVTIAQKQMAADQRLARIRNERRKTHRTVPSRAPARRQRREHRPSR